MARRLTTAPVIQTDHGQRATSSEGLLEMHKDEYRIDNVAMHHSHNLTVVRKTVFQDMKRVPTWSKDYNACFISIFKLQKYIKINLPQNIKQSIEF